MSVRHHYRFVIAKDTGVQELGEGVYPYPLARGQVVTLVDRAVPLPIGDGVMTSEVRCLIEQVLHPQILVRPLGAVVPLPFSAGDVMVVYVSLLDAAGFIIPHSRGVVPGLHIVPAG